MLSKTNGLAHALDPGNLVSSTAARKTPTTRTGGQDDGNYTKLPQINLLSNFRKSNFSKTLEKRWPTNEEDPSDFFLEILNMGSISSRKHEMDIWYVYFLKECFGTHVTYYI